VSAGATSIEIRTCRGCGCTDGRACFGGCSWATEDVCSTCFMAHELLATTSRAPKGARAATMPALQIELRVLGRTWGDDFTDLMLTLAQKYALGNEAGATALIAAQRTERSARARALVRPTRLPQVVREARALVAVARKAAS